MSKFIYEFRDKLLIICILVIVFDAVCLSGTAYADGASTSGTMISSCSSNYDSPTKRDDQGRNCPVQGDSDGKKYNRK